MSDPLVTGPDGEAPDGDVLARVLDGLRALPEQGRGPDEAAAPAGPDHAVPLPRRRRD